MYVDESEEISLSEATQEQLLAELLRRRPPQEAPTKRELCSGRRISTIDIGKDHTADITIYKDDLAVLRNGSYVRS